MRAVLFDAVECFRKHTSKSSCDDRRLAHEAEQWLFADDIRWPFSFVNICTVLGLDPSYMRRGLRGYWKPSLTRPAKGRLQRRVVPRSSPLMA
jgi:hypothetical protein